MVNKLFDPLQDASEHEVRNNNSVMLQIIKSVVTSHKTEVINLPANIKWHVVSYCQLFLHVNTIKIQGHHLGQSISTVNIRYLFSHYKFFFTIVLLLPHRHHQHPFQQVGSLQLTTSQNMQLFQLRTILSKSADFNDFIVFNYNTLTPWLMEPESSILHSQGLSNNPNLEPESTQILVLISISLRFIPILSSHLCLGLPKGLFPVGVPVIIKKALLPSSILTT